MVTNNLNYRYIENLIVAKLRANHLKLTRQRRAIVEVLARKTHHHPGVRQIYKEAKKLCPRLNLSTVYYTLGLFSKRGIIKELEFEDMENRYELNMEHHINLVCKRCGHIVDYKPVEVDFGEVEDQLGFRATTSRFELYGYCNKCGKK